MGELAKQHRHELRPAGEALGGAPGFMLLDEATGRFARPRNNSLTID
jgi:hypothetical protein